MSMVIQGRVANLEAEVKSLRKALDDLVQLFVAQAPMAMDVKNANPNGPRQMCPKCGEVPNYHLHVRSCKGKKMTAQI